MDLTTVKSFNGSMMDIMDLSESKYASFRIVRQDDGHYSASLLLNSDTNLSGRQKSKAKRQRDTQRKKDFLSKKSAINPKSPEAASHKEPRKVGTGNSDNTSQSPKNSVAGAGADHRFLMVFISKIVSFFQKNIVWPQYDLHDRWKVTTGGQKYMFSNQTDMYTKL